MKTGVLGTGYAAGLLAGTLAQLEESECCAVASRSLERAEKFAAEYGFQKAYGSYEELAADKEVELVFVATPHSHHYEHMKLCMEHGKAVLCEKSFTMNSLQARRIMEFSRERRVFASEAMWPRYMPSRKIINDMIASGIVGRISVMTANLSYVIAGNERIIRPDLAGGALLDVGVYAVNFALTHLGDDIERIETSVRFTDTGVDGMETITLFYRDGKMASLTAGIFGRSDRKGIFYGEKGYIVVENINNPQSVAAYDLEDRLLKMEEVPPQISGYEYEIRECIREIEKGRTESVSIPLADSVRMMEVLDEVRRQWGLVYPGE